MTFGSLGGRPRRHDEALGFEGFAVTRGLHVLVLVSAVAIGSGMVAGGVSESARLSRQVNGQNLLPEPVEPMRTEQELQVPFGLGPEPLGEAGELLPPEPTAGRVPAEMRRGSAVAASRIFGSRFGSESARFWP
jgi:hypothetical protein